MTCGICGREQVWHGSEHPAGRPGTYLSEAGCHDGVLMDDDEHAEGWAPDTLYHPCPHHPERCTYCDGGGNLSPELAEKHQRDDCPKCAYGWIGRPHWPVVAELRPASK